MTAQRLESLVWHDDIISIDGVRFRVYEEFGAAPSLEDADFWLFKGRPLLEDYLAVFRRRPDLDVRNLFELGIWESGSVAFWSLLLQPDRHVAIDLAPPREPAELKRMLRRHDLADRVSTHWLLNQADDTRLSALVEREFAGPLDLVIDDASHCYAPTSASLVTLLPRLREGGIYIVEDWGWSLSPEVSAAFPADEPGLVPLLDRLLPLLHLNPGLLRNVDVLPTLFVLERGPMPAVEARELLAGVLEPRFEASPSLTARVVKGSPLWRVGRAIKRRLKS
jgi:hypothetical protein